MMSEQQQQQRTHELWEPLPPENDVQELLAQYSRRRPRVVRRTIALRFHKPTWRKVQNLLWASKHYHNYIVAMLETLREDPKQFRDDGAFECIREMMIRREEIRKRGKNSGRPVRILAEVIAERFRKPMKPQIRKSASHAATDAQDSLPADNADDIADDTSYESRRRPPLRLLEPQDYPIIHTLRPGAARRCALMLLNFYIQSQKVPKKQEPLSDDPPKDADNNATFEHLVDHPAIEEMLEAEIDAFEAEGIPTIEALHQTWAQRWIRYEESAKTRIPRGRHRGKPFGEALAVRRIRTGRRRGKLVRKPSKRRVRWLKEHTYPLQHVTDCLAAVQVLLHRGQYGDTSDEVLAAEQVRHLWKYEPTTYRSPRARRDAQYRVTQSRQLATLGSLSNEELYTLRDELYELLDHARQYEQIAEAVEIFLEHAPPSYPTLEPALFLETDERAEHRRALDWFSQPVTPAAAKDDGREDDPLSARNSVAELLHSAENEAVTRLLQAESELGERALQPLVYTRTMRPPKPKPCWALLYKRHRLSSKELQDKYKQLPPHARQKKIEHVQSRNGGYIYKFELVLVVHHMKQAFMGNRAADYFAPNMREGEYFYVNFPLTPFVPPEQVSLMTFPLECGEAYQETLLHELIERLRTDQQARYESQFLDTEPTSVTRKPVEACLPQQAALGEATIITHLNGDGWYEFFLHCAVPVATLPCETSPVHILGLHQHQNGYSWALIDQTGTLLETGDLPIPWYVRPRPGHRTYSDNYAFEVARQIVALAQKHRALIAIQNTWTNKKASPSARHNQRTFGHPSRKVYDQVVWKAVEVGLPRPRHVFGVSRQICGQCGNKQNNKIGTQPLKACPACGSLSRAAHIQFPLAIPVAITQGKPVPWVLLAQEQENGVRAAAMADFFFWTLSFGRAGDVSSAETQQACIAGLEKLQWKGRQVFHVRTGRNHHTSRSRQRESNGTEQAQTNGIESVGATRKARPAFRPRRLAADFSIAGSQEWEAVFQQWIAAYKQAVPDVLIDYRSVPRETALKVLYKDDDLLQQVGEVDAVLLDTPVSKDELSAGLIQQEHWFCQDCGQHWQVSESWFRCTHETCRHDALARFNAATVVAQVALRDLVKRACEQ